MPIDAGEIIEWSATSLILLPTIKNRLNTMLPELFRLLASLQELRAGDHITAAREAQHYTALHSEFHQAPELAVGNWVLAMAGELIAPGLNQHFRAPMQQSRQLYDLMSWRRGKAYNLRILLTVANLSPPELTSPLLPERRVRSLEDDARQDPGTDSPGGTDDAGFSLTGTTMLADTAQGLTMVLWSPPHQADSFRNLQTQQKEPATVRLVLHFSRKVWSMINLQSAFAAAQANVVDDGGSAKAVQRKDSIGAGLEVPSMDSGASSEWCCARASAGSPRAPGTC